MTDELKLTCFQNLANLMQLSCIAIKKESVGRLPLTPCSSLGALPGSDCPIKPLNTLALSLSCRGVLTFGTQRGAGGEGPGSCRAGPLELHRRCYTRPSHGPTSWMADDGVSPSGFGSRHPGRQFLGPDNRCALIGPSSSSCASSRFSARAGDVLIG